MRFRCFFLTQHSSSFLMLASSASATSISQSRISAMQWVSAIEHERRLSHTRIATSMKKTIRIAHENECTARERMGDARGIAETVRRARPPAPCTREPILCIDIAQHKIEFTGTPHTTGHVERARNKSHEIGQQRGNIRDLFKAFSSASQEGNNTPHTHHDGLCEDDYRLTEA